MLPSVLFVAHDPALVAELRPRLGRHFEVETAREAAEVRAAIRRRLPGVIVASVGMPDMDIVEWCRGLRTDARLGTVPVLFVSDDASLDLKIRALSVGDDFIVRPFDFGELLARIRNLLRPPRISESVDVSLAVLGRGRTSDEELADRIRAVVTASLHDASFGVPQLAGSVGLSERQLRRRCVSAIGQSPKAYIRRERLDRADALLRSRAYTTVGEVAAAVGWTASHLSRAFVEEFGVPPSTLIGG